MNVDNYNLEDTDGGETDHEVALQHLSDQDDFDRFNKFNKSAEFNGLTEEDKLKQKRLYEQVEVLQKKLQKQIDKDCGRAYLLSYKKEVETPLTLNKESLKELLREHLTIKVVTDKNYGHYEDCDSISISVSIMFDDEEICGDNSSVSI